MGNKLKQNCLDCNIRLTTKNRVNNPHSRGWRLCKKCVNIRQRKHYQKPDRKKIHKKQQRIQCLRKRYGLTLEQYDLMFAEQSGKCFICDEIETQQLYGVVRRLAVDHNHKTNKVRKLLCHRCNRTLGSADDNINLLSEMIKYLKEN